MYRFTELSTRAQLIAIGNEIKDLKELYPDADFTIEQARSINEQCDDTRAYSAKGVFMSGKDIEGFYVRQVPSTGAWVYYYYFDHRLMVLDTVLDRALGVIDYDWRESIHQKPFKSLGFKELRNL